MKYLAPWLALAAVTACESRRPPPRPVTPAPPAPPPQTTAPAWSVLDGILRASVRPTGVDYAAVRARSRDLVAFHDTLARNGPTATPERYPTPDAKRAYWLNAYNATVLRGIVEGPENLRSVEDLAPDFGFFRARRWAIDGRSLKLDDIEHAELLDVYHDPRFHVALNCGARSCPPLRASIYEPASIDQQLDEQATRYVNAEGNVTLDPTSRQVRVVQLFEWFGTDFARPVPGHPPPSTTGPLAFVYTFAESPLRTRLTQTCGNDGARCTLTFNPYDWTLNRAP